MNKSQLIDALAARFDGNKKAAAHALESVLDTITREMAKGEKVAITGFGSFEKRLRPARLFRNPLTGEQVKTKKTFVPKFNPGADLKNVVSGVKKLPKLTFPTLPGKKAAAGTAATSSAAPVKVAASKSAAAKKTPAVAKTTTTKSAPAKKTATKSTAKKATAKTTGSAGTTTASKKATPSKAAASEASAAKKAAAKPTTAKRSAAKKSS